MPVLNVNAFQAMHFSDWFAEHGVNTGKDWLLLGKGPSFSRQQDYPLENYHTVALNHVIREQAAVLAHMIDFDVVEACGESIERNARYLLMPWAPHINLRPTEKTLADLLAKNETLARMHAQGRLLWYNLGTAKVAKRGNYPVVKSGHFNAEVMVNLLVDHGVNRIRSLGVDGGTAYSEAFHDLNDTTRLSNAHASYDKQFLGIAQQMLHRGLDYAPLHLDSPIRVFVGAEAEQTLAVRVLSYSIQKHASMTVDVVPLYETKRAVPMPEKVENRPKTHFSFQRFLIPELAGYQGRAIYLDSDMLVFQDITQLWTHPFEEADLLCVQEPETTGRNPQFSVLVLDCEALRWNIDIIVRDLDTGRYTYPQLMHDMVVANRPNRCIASEWNSLERYEPGETALIHYTDVPTQPWISTDNPHGELWVRVLIEAVTENYITLRELEESLQQGDIRPSLYYQVKHRIPETAALPAWVRWLDKDYLPPYKRLKKTKKRLLKTIQRELAKPMARML